MAPRIFSAAVDGRSHRHLGLVQRYMKSARQQCKLTSVAPLSIGVTTATSTTSSLVVCHCSAGAEGS